MGRTIQPDALSVEGSLSSVIISVGVAVPAPALAVDASIPALIVLGAPADVCGDVIVFAPVQGRIDLNPC